MMDFWKKIPTKFLITFTLAVFLFLCALVWYAVIYKNTPVEIFGIVKFGERDDALRARLVKALTDAESRIAPEVHNAVLVKLKDAEARTSSPNIEAGKLKLQLKDRENKIAELGKELAEMNKEFTETKRTFEATKKDLQLSRKEFQERAVQLDELKKKVEEISLANKNRGVYGFVQQLIALEKMVQGPVDSWNESPYVNSYNEILTGLKRELPTDAYLQSANPLSASPATATVAASLRSSVPRLRIYIEQRYLK